MVAVVGAAAVIRRSSSWRPTTAPARPTPARSTGRASRTPSTRRTRTITVNVQTINWNDFDNQVQTMVQNKQYPDITEGDYFANYAQEGLLYPASDVFGDPSEPAAGLQEAGHLQRHASTACRSPPARARCSTTRSCSQRPGSASAPQTWADIQADAAEDQGEGRHRIRPAARLGGGSGRVVCCGCSATAATTPTAAESGRSTARRTSRRSSSSSSWSPSGVTEPNPGTKNRTDLWKQFAQGQIGMINGSPALIPIIQAGKRAHRLRLGVGADRRARPAR